ncbi:MAG: ABC transporter ATP-binding protein [Microcoleaceae cyanobacterium]
MARYLSKVLYILPGKKSSLIFLILSFIGVSVLEVFGLGVVGPFMTLSANPQIIHQAAALEWLYQLLGLQKERDFVALMGVVIILIFCVKSFVSWCVQTAIFRYTYRRKCDLTKKLMHSYLNAPYAFHLSKNSSHIIQNLITETKQFSERVLIPLLNSTSNCIVAASLSILLVVTNVLAVVVILGIVLPLLVFFNLFKNKISAWGKEASQSDQETIRIINHGLGGIKETKVIGCEPYFESQVAIQAQRFTDAASKFYAYKLSPRVLIETIIVVFLLGFIVVSLLLGQDIQKLMPTLSVFALVSIRLIPAMTNVTNGISTLKNSSYAVNKLYADLKEFDRFDQESDKALMYLPSLSGQRNGSINSQYSEGLELEYEVTLSDIKYHYPDAEINALEGISLTLKKGQSIALIGKSGAGKTTLVDVILGLLIPQSGDIQVDGQSIYDGKVRAWQDLVGYIPQSIFLIDDTVERNIAFGVPDHLVDAERLGKAIQAAQLEEVIANLPSGLKTMVGERGVLLSGGQRQRVGIARALYHGREVLVLDEATAALDTDTENLVTQAINSLSGMKTMIIIAHRLATVEHCDRVYVLDRGRIVRSGRYEEVVLGSDSNVTTELK